MTRDDGPASFGRAKASNNIISKSWLQNAIRIVGGILVVLSIVFLLIKLRDDFHRIPEFGWGVQKVFFLGAAVLFRTGTVVFASCIWAFLLRSGNASVPYRNAFTLIGQAQISKYLPGNIFEYVKRLDIGVRQGISLESILITTGLETVIVLATALFIVISSFLFDQSLWLWIQQHLIYKKMIILIAVGFIVITTATIWFFPSVRRWIELRASYRNPRRILIAFFLDTTLFVLYAGIAAFLLAFVFGAKSGLQWHQFIARVTLSWVAGFVAPGVPAGIGVQEAAFVALFNQQIGGALALTLAFSLRLVGSLGDLVAYILAYWLGKTNR